MRRFGEAYDAKQRYILRPGAYAILHVGTQVLLTFQESPKPELQLPGGGIDKGEQTLPALHREIQEETGWRATKLRRLGVYKRFVYMPDYDLWAEKHCTIFTGRPVRDLKTPLEESHLAVWSSAAEAADLLANDGDRYFLKSYFDL